MAKPFVLPTSSSPLRFRYTTYLGENHPAARKVVLEFCPADMPNLTDVQRRKLIKLLGPRYNPETEVAKMSSDSFDNQAQNKRYLGDLVDTLLVEARVGYHHVTLDYINQLIAYSGSDGYIRGCAFRYTTPRLQG